MEEMVWVVSTELLNKTVPNLKGFRKMLFKALEPLFNNAEFLKRSEAEYNETFKQIIPYVVFTKENKILVVKRTKKQTEKRLHEKLSIGIGGHINPIDDANHGEMTLLNGLNREINEELEINNLKKLEYQGLLYNDSNEVSRVHLGIVFKATVDDAKIKEKENFELSWMTTQELELHKEKLEEWSIITFESLKKLGELK